MVCRCGRGGRRLCEPGAFQAFDFEMVHLSKPQAPHDEQPIFSVDVHPDGQRFATGGNDNRVKLWALQPCIDESAEADGGQPRLSRPMRPPRRRQLCALVAQRTLPRIGL